MGPFISDEVPMTTCCPLHCRYFSKIGAQFSFWREVVRGIIGAGHGVPLKLK